MLKTTIEKEVDIVDVERYMNDPQVETFLDEPVGMYASRVDAIALEQHNKLIDFIKAKANKRHENIIESSNPEDMVQELCMEYELILQELAAFKDLNHQIAERYQQVIRCLPDLDEIKVEFKPIYNTLSPKIDGQREMFIKLCQGYKEEIKKFNK